MTINLYRNLLSKGRYFVKFKTEHLFCSPRILQSIHEVREIYSCIDRVKWREHFTFNHNGKTLEHQTAYNKAFDQEFKKSGWELQPLLYNDPKLIGDFQKNDVFVEVQFGNTYTIYRDYYKFHFGLMHSLLSLAVLIVPTDPNSFFPSREKRSITNMAQFDLAVKYYKLLPIPVPILIIGLLPEN